MLHLMLVALFQILPNISATGDDTISSDPAGSVTMYYTDS